MAVIGMSEEKRSGGPRTPWRSIYLSCLIVAIAGVNMTMFTTSLWPFLLTVTKDAEVQWLGWALAATSLGSIVAGPVLGWFQQSYNTWQPLVGTFIITFFGNLSYGLLPNFPERYTIYVLLGSRVLLGFAASAINLLRTYAAVNADERDRQAASCYIGLGLSVGLSLGPVIQAIFIPLGRGFRELGVFEINEYTLPAFMMAGSSLLIIIIVVILFDEDQIVKPQEIDMETANDAKTELPQLNVMALAVLFYIWCLLMSAGTDHYAIAAPLTMAMYGWSGEEVVTRHGAIQTLQCLSSATTNTIIIKSGVKKIDHRKQLMFSMFLFAFAGISLYPWPFYRQINTINDFQNDMNMTSLNTTECDQDPRICVGREVPLWLYVLILGLFYGPATSIGISTTNTLVSLVLGPRKQGLIQGWMSAAGALASFLCPIGASYLFSRDGMRTLALVNGVIHIMAIIFILFSYKKLRRPSLK